MRESELTTPVAFFIFNRPHVTKKVFEAIRTARPSKLLVIADGARAEKEGEEEKCHAARQIIETVDWDCEVLKNYAAANMGCRKRVSSGLDWVFANEEEAIILEDDCLPTPSFFRFCSELLEKYRFDERIITISGTNLVGNFSDLKNSYFFSKYPHIWGWATWRRAWKHYDVNIISWPEMKNSSRYMNFSADRKECLFWRDLFDKIYGNKIDTWDAQITYMSFSREALTIIPGRNMISNLGFGNDATHTKKISHMANLPSFGMEWPIEHPEKIMRDIDKDDIRKKEYISPSLPTRLLQRMKKLYERNY